MENELQILIQNILNPNKKIREPSELKINELADQNLGTLFFKLSLIICHEDENKIIRRISCTIIKSLLSKENYIKLWFNTDENLRNTIKNNLVSSLASQDIDIRKATALAISTICKYEFPKKMWLNLFDVLINTSNNQNLFYQLSSIMTLSYIFEEIDINDINDNIRRNVLFAFYKILNQNNINFELYKETLDALDNFIPFIKDIIINKEHAKIFFELIEKSIKNDSDIIRSKSIKIFIDISRRYYDYLEDYINNLINITSKILEKDTNENSLLAYEIWCSIGEIEVYRKNEVEIKKNKNIIFFEFCQKSLIHLFPILQNHIIQNDYDNDEWNQRKASSTLIDIFSKCCQINFIEKIIEFVDQLTSETNYYLKHAGLYTYSSILETFYHDDLIDKNKEILYIISQIFNDKNNPEHLKYIASYTLERITFYYSEEIISEKNVLFDIIDLIINNLTQHKNNIKVNLCQTINNLNKELIVSENIYFNEFTEYLEKIINILLNLGILPESYDPNNNVTLNCFYTISILIEHSARDSGEVVKVIFKKLINYFSKTLDASSFKNNEIRFYYQSYILISLSAFFSTSYFCIEENDILTLFQYIIQSFNDRNNIYEEGMSIIGLIFLVINQKNFEQLINIFFEYLIFGLKSINDISLCKTTILTTNKIIQNIYFDNNNNLLSQIMENIFQILLNPKADKSLKPISLNVIGELFLCCKNQCFNYFDKSMNILKSAMEISIKIDKLNEDEDIINYYYQLRETIILTFTYIFSTICEKNFQNNFFQYVVVIMKYINSICLNETNENILEECLGLIIDFCNEYKNAMKNYIDFNIINNIFSTLKKNIKNNKNPKLSVMIEYSENKIKEIK